MENLDFEHPPFYTWGVVRGDDTARAFEYKDLTGSVIDLTDVTAELDVTRAGSTTTYPVAVDGPTGTLTVLIPNSVTSDWSSDCTYQLRLITEFGARTTILTGVMEISQ